MKPLAALLIPLALILAACGPATEEQPAPEPTARTQVAPEVSPGPTVTIRVNNGPRPGETQRQEEWDLMVSMFQERHPNIRVVVTDWAYDPEGFAARAISGDLETVINTWATEGFRMIQEGLAADITDLMETWEPAAEIHPQVAALFQRGGRWYGMPIYAYSMALFMNRQPFAEVGILDSNGDPAAPATWDELKQFAELLTDHSIPRYGLLIQGENPRGGWHSLNWGWQAGGEFEALGPDGLWHATFASPQIAAAFDFLQGLRWEERATPPSATLRHREAWQMFAAGQGAMMAEAASEHFLNALRDEYGFDLANVHIGPLPAGPGGRAHQLGADYLMISSQATEEERRAAFEWLTWWHDPEWIQAKWALRERQGRAVGYPEVPIFRGELGQLIRDVVDRHRTFPRCPLYEEGIVGTLRPEPPVACQALYREVLSPTLQAVLGDADANALALLQSLQESFEREHIAPFNAQMRAAQTP